ncbi:MAG: type-F conjugative transfer system secretin TraK [Alphaproteobacteria bacterium]|nr:type-F conjugative transfer system secretin TraK [Alphaproteobacteria bacterium]
MNRLSLSLTTGFILVCGTHTLLAKKQVFTLDEDKIIHASASAHGRTRISFQGDRLKEVMGLPEDMELEKDEERGILYLGAMKDPLSISLVTENGLVQDMELTPSQEKTAQIVLKDVFQEQIDGDKDDLQHPFLGPSSLMPSKVSYGHSEQGEKTYHQKNLILIQKLYQGEGEACSDVDYEMNHAALNISYKKSLSGYGLHAHMFEIKNTGIQPQSLCEKDFYKKGATSIALSHKSLMPKQTGYMFVVTKK